MKDFDIEKMFLKEKLTLQRIKNIEIQYADDENICCMIYDPIQRLRRELESDIGKKWLKILEQQLENNNETS